MAAWKIGQLYASQSSVCDHHTAIEVDKVTAAASAVATPRATESMAPMALWRAVEIDIFVFPTHCLSYKSKAQEEKDFSSPPIAECRRLFLLLGTVHFLNNVPGEKCASKSMPNDMTLSATMVKVYLA